MVATDRRVDGDAVGAAGGGRRPRAAVEHRFGHLDGPAALGAAGKGIGAALTVSLKEALGAAAATVSFSAESDDAFQEAGGVDPAERDCAGASRGDGAL